MSNIRLPRTLCAVVNEVLRGSHTTLDVLFKSAGAPGDPPPLSHPRKWNEWLFRAGQDPNVDSLSVLGNVIEEFMGVPPNEFSEDYEKWQSDRARLVEALEQSEFRYFREGRVVPTGSTARDEPLTTNSTTGPLKPESIDDLLTTILSGLRRAMHPLTHRRKGAQTLTFLTEYDVQDLLHALLRPWVADIRPEEFTPSYAGSRTRMDFLLPRYGAVIELKFVRDRNHARKVGDELIVDIEHYRRHPNCKSLWCTVFDPEHLLTNPDGLKRDLEGSRRRTTDLWRSSSKSSRPEGRSREGNTLRTRAANQS